jgi:hypothetical protein
MVERGRPIAAVLLGEAQGQPGVPDGDPMLDPLGDRERPPAAPRRGSGEGE